MVGRFRKGPSFAEDYDMDDKSSKPIFSQNGNHLKAVGNKNLEMLIEEYNDYHKKWIQQVQHISKQDV